MFYKNYFRICWVHLTHSRTSLIRNEFCVQNKSSIPHDIPLQHVCNPGPVHTLSYHAFVHPQHAKEIASSNANIVMKMQSLIVNLQGKRCNDVIDQEPFTYTHFYNN